MIPTLHQGGFGVAIATVDDPITLSGSPSNPTIGSAYAGFTPTKSGGGSATITYTLDSGVLPAGMSLNASTCEITGTPTQSGAYPIVLRGSNGVDTDGTLNITLTVNFTVVGLLNSYTAGYLGADVNTDYLFQALNTTPSAVATGNPVGLVLSRNGSLQANLFANGTFAADTDWTKGTGWAIASGKATHTAGSGSTNITQAPSLTLNELARYKFDVLDRTASGLRPQFTGGATVTGATISANSTDNIQWFRASATHTAAGFNAAASGFDGSVDNAFLQKQSGISFLQITAGDRATWVDSASPADYFNFDGAGDNYVANGGGGSTTGFTLVIGMRNAAAGTGANRTLFDDSGTNTGLRLRTNTSEAVEFRAGNGTTTTTVTSAALSLDTDYVLTAIYNGSTLSLQVNNGTPVTTAFSSLSAGAAQPQVLSNIASGNTHNGRCYALYFIKNAALNAATLADVKADVAAKSGVTL